MQREQTEWDDVNKALQNHGFKTACFSDPVENKNLSDLVLLDRKSAADMRTTLRTMLSDSDRRQALIQELIKSNNQLKEEAQEHMGRAARQSQRVTELEGLQDVVKAKVQELEDRYLGNTLKHHGQTQQLQKENQDVQKLCLALEQRLCEQRAEASHLQRKLYFTVKEEEKRLARQDRAIQNLCKQDAPAEQRLLDVIDFYETRMVEQLSELRRLKGEAEGSQLSNQERTQKRSADVTPSFRSILKVFQEELQESRAQKEELKREVERLKEDVETRAMHKEVRFNKYMNQRLGGLNKHKSTRSTKDSKRVTHLSEAETFSELTTDDSLSSHYYNMLNEVSGILTNPKAPLRLHRQKPKSSSVGVEVSEFQSVLPSLELWAQQLHLLRELQHGLNKLTERLMPWQPTTDGSNESVKVEDMMLQVDIMLEHTETEDDRVLRSPTRHTLESMLAHFQKLFDVATLSGVYPRMNELYSRLGEMNNATKNLRDILDLDHRAPLSELVNRVDRLVSSSRDGVGLQICSLLGDADIDTIIVKLKQHEEFFPVFHSLLKDILQTLGVNRLDEVLPVLRSLTQR
ncbi:centrosomal protein of 70 kDa isoform X2 [Genypterus blacodes]|uniref:centrosomal protein of 70 kDa isoform X2 n=1 Tax=Genypterus blacodes TaxID=154954 RepID=UPI003F76D354